MEENNQREIKTMNDTKITFMCSAPLAQLISKVAFDADRNKSEVIRACILLSIDAVNANPTLANRIAIEDRKDHQISTR